MIGFSFSQCYVDYCVRHKRLEVGKVSAVRLRTPRKERWQPELGGANGNAENWLNLKAIKELKFWIY